MLTVKTKLGSRWPAKLHGDADKGPGVNFTTQTKEQMGVQQELQEASQRPDKTAQVTAFFCSVAAA